MNQSKGVKNNNKIRQKQQQKNSIENAKDVKTKGKIK